MLLCDKNAVKFELHTSHNIQTSRRIEEGEEDPRPHLKLSNNLMSKAPELGAMSMNIKNIKELLR